MSEKEIHNLILAKLEKLDDKLDDLGIVVATGITDHEARLSAIEKAHDTGNGSERAGVVIAAVAVIISIAAVMASCNKTDHHKNEKNHNINTDIIHPDTFELLRASGSR